MEVSFAGKINHFPWPMAMLVITRGYIPLKPPFCWLNPIKPPLNHHFPMVFLWFSTIKPPLNHGFLEPGPGGYWISPSHGDKPWTAVDTVAAIRRVRCYRRQQQDRLVDSFPVELYMYTHRYYTQCIYIYIHTYIYILYILYIYYFQHLKFLHRDFAKAPTVELTPPMVVSDSPPKKCGSWWPVSPLGYRWIQMMWSF